MIASFWSSLVLLCRSLLAQSCLVQFIPLVQENSISSSIDLYLCACFCLFRVQINFDHPNFQNSKQYQSQCSPLQNSPLLYPCAWQWATDSCSLDVAFQPFSKSLLKSGYGIYCFSSILYLHWDKSPYNLKQIMSNQSSFLVPFCSRIMSNTSVSIARFLLGISNGSKYFARYWS